MSGDSAPCQGVKLLSFRHGSLVLISLGEELGAT
jgi:hypothetical protein